MMMATPLALCCLILSLSTFVNSQTNPCVNISVPTNGKVNCGQYQNFTTCIATCNDGYRFETLSAVEKRVCDNSDGVWFNGDTFPKCIAPLTQEPCHPLTPPENGVIKCEGTDSELICTAICNDGYIFETKASIVKKVCDTYDKTWYNGVTIPACVGKNADLCQPPVQPLNGLVKCESTKDKLVCTAICNDGFAFKNFNQSVVKKICLLANGLWIDGDVNIPKCEVSTTQKMCSAISASDRNIVRCEDSHSILKCTARCKSGYAFETGDMVVQRICNQIDGRWLNGKALPLCRGTCDESLLDTVRDDKLTASSQYGKQNGNFSASKARMSINLPQDGHTNFGWRPQSDDLNQYIQVELNNISRITGIVTQGLRGSGNTNYVTRFRILHSVDGRIFTSYGDQTVSDKFLTGNYDSDSVVTNKFDCPFTAKYIRINPLEWQGHIGLRFDLRGCKDKSVPIISTPSIAVSTPATKRTVTVVPNVVTQTPQKSCRLPAQPANGVVYCQGTPSELVCTAQCKDGYEFSTKDTLIKRACNKKDGMWINGDNYPPCIALPTALPTTQSTDRSCISSQIDCLNKKNGDFQTCGACHFYASCSEGYVYVRPCPTNLLFDLTTGRCNYRSDTCFHESSPLVGK